MQGCTKGGKDVGSVTKFGTVFRNIWVLTTEGPPRLHSIAYIFVMAPYIFKTFVHPSHDVN